MQRILSVETSRNGSASSEFVTKRLCCSIILTVLFFSMIGGFFLGRFETDQRTFEIKKEFHDLSRRVTILNNNLQKTFRIGSNQSSQLCNNIFFLRCNFSDIGNNDTGQLLPANYLSMLNGCFGN